MKRTCYLPLIVILVIPEAFSQSLGGVTGSTEHHVKGTFKCTRTSQGTSSTTSSSEAADADMTHITTLAQHDTTKSTERPVTTKEGVKNQSMYWISDDKVTWTEAVDRCRNLSNNGHLVHIDNEEENDEVKAFREQTLGGFNWIWIGIHDSEKEGVWTYEDGSNLTYVNWGYGEPNSGNGYVDEDCAVMSKGGDYIDANCEIWKLHFCCEYYVVI
ncbi:C-type lectin 1-like [Apostichopus japonicus]|uniref:C-type lectin 1-like n=1 Tax=Stichopus japonicus TaxID=307972 RepID=UPI003AB60ED1